MENLEEFNLIELKNEELLEVEGGILDILVSAVALAGAVYGAGYVCGKAYYYATH
ncbi:class IIb bacteriocin, lactobin A/cerein 7B family [Flavobacterium chilense]|uniref:Class IIb bacteriocin, lactobin A/cerein 7B family n=1 Tax=Flavobacterium chilense TaxID=946677 RepID=A0A1M7CDD6_9FLAO|nr:class IIb bacteriocin, lactobin A/cerein 7B family [Flavobacterium chilense]SHL65210.1 class IIb bacteriocin, lactobin A/cerein 7B family [Flavobacterium chilense]